MFVTNFANAGRWHMSTNCMIGGRKAERWMNPMLFQLFPVNDCWPRLWRGHQSVKRLADMAWSLELVRLKSISCYCSSFSAAWRYDISCIHYMSSHAASSLNTVHCMWVHVNAYLSVLAHFNILKPFCCSNQNLVLQNSGAKKINSSSLIEKSTTHHETRHNAGGQSVLIIPAAMRTVD